MSTVYLIHLDTPIHHARHYLSFCASETLQERLHRHTTGNGARLLNVANQRGITYSVVRTWNSATWKTARALERKLKAQKNGPRLCPVCNPRVKGECNHGDNEN